MLMKTGVKFVVGCECAGMVVAACGTAVSRAEAPMLLRQTYM